MKKKVTIIGEVHDVGYRPFLLGLAESLEVERFFADNTYVSSRQAVYALVDSSEEKVNAFIEIASSKFPENSRVERVEVEDYAGSVMKTENYYRYLTAAQLGKIATYGGKMLKKQGEMLEKQDKMLKKQGEMLSKQDKMLGKMDEMLSKQDETIRAIREEGERNREALKDHLAEDIARIYEEIDEIKATLARVLEKVGA
ncbi:MAG: acylphosphatase [Euryarchaeota archaeon]|nr:acylphosphatase [Euryarchaeota archaeon]